MLARHEAPSWQVNQGGIWQPVGFFRVEPGEPVEFLSSKFGILSFQEP